MQQVMALQWKEDKDLLSYFTYSPQPHFILEQHRLRNFSSMDLQYFNMQAQPLIVMPDQWHPRSMVYVDKRTGELVLRGSVGRFVELLAWKLNASMKFPLPIRPGQVLHPNEVLRLSRELPIDIPVSMMLASQPEDISSYPFELTHICLMIPLSQQLPLREIYRLLANVQNVLIALAILYGYGFFLSLHKYLSVGIGSWVDFLLNDRAFRGLLGQSFHLSLSSCRSVSIKAVYFSLSIMGLYLSCFYEAALGTMLTHPPKRFQPRTVNDLREVGLRMAINEADVAIGMEMDVPLHTVNGSEFTRLRDGFNISYVYLASRLHWTLFSQQQKYFDKELFLYSMDACLSTLTLMTFPLTEDSWFAEPITRLNFAARANGIYQYYVGMHFHDMASAGLVSFNDLSQNQRPEDRHGGTLKLDDLKWISYAYVVLLMFAFLVLAIEIMWKRFA
ncbi:uncharacterized protein Ir54a [Drosophila tropicalis]|uniref:uncharacterized protein Ir54a n=1 Tax=Drosophila tropicalis TaxID=46794 RepID=UPI0035AB6A87